MVRKLDIRYAETPGVDAGFRWQPSLTFDAGKTKQGPLPVNAMQLVTHRGMLIPAADGPPNAGSHQPWVTPPVRAPGVDFRTFESRAANARVSFHIYTPEAYDREQERRFPVLYWLHGSGGGLRGIPQLARHFDSAIAAGKAPPFLAVFVNGLVEGLYVDWKDTSTPLETVIVKDLVPHVDATWLASAA